MYSKFISNHFVYSELRLMKNIIMFNIFVML